MGASPASLDHSYPSLDPLSRYVDAIGRDAAQERFYDHLVAYVGEVMRVRAKGSWQLDASTPDESYPYIAAAQHAPIMPINAVWSAFLELDGADLRGATTHEVRSARARFFPGPPLIR
jgi:hypothetical protein